ncbi:MAG: class B sortase [Ruminococcus sp.]|nr:class B sortase [Ruminococcus sp.]
MKKKLMYAAAVLLFALAGFFIYQVISRQYQIRKAESDNSRLREEVMSENDGFSDLKPGQTEGGDNEEKYVEDSLSGDITYRYSVDFDKLWERNADACAWIDIPHTDMSFPIAQHPSDDNYYLERNFSGQKSIYGAAYIELYNNRDFNDNVTVVYGHDISNGQWFGQLETIFTDPETFEKSKDIILYLPSETRTYRVFAALPYSDKHLMQSYDFTKKEVFEKFIEQILETRNINSIIRPEDAPEFGDKLLVLETCLKGDYSHRFLVLARKR